MFHSEYISILVDIASTLILSEHTSYDYLNHVLFWAE